MIRTQLENNQNKHERIFERLINQQVWALTDFQEAFADRIDPCLFQATAPETKSGYFEFIRGEDFLVEKQGEISELLNELQIVIQDGKEDSIPMKDLVSQSVNDPVDPFTDQIKVNMEICIERHDKDRESKVALLIKKNVKASKTCLFRSFMIASLKLYEIGKRTFLKTFNGNILNKREFYINNLHRL